MTKRKVFKLFGVEIQKSFNPHDGRNQIFIRWKPRSLAGPINKPFAGVGHIPELKPKKPKTKQEI